MKTILSIIIVGMCIALTSCTSYPIPYGSGGYQAALAAARSVPPQVRNNWNRALNPYQMVGNPWQQNLNYWRSMPREVRNEMVRRQQMGY